MFGSYRWCYARSPLRNNKIDSLKVWGFNSDDQACTIFSRILDARDQVQQINFFYLFLYIDGFNPWSFWSNLMFFESVSDTNYIWLDSYFSTIHTQSYIRIRYSLILRENWGLSLKQSILLLHTVSIKCLWTKNRGSLLKSSNNFKNLHLNFNFINVINQPYLSL